MSRKTGGIVFGSLGALWSIFFGIILPWLYPEFSILFGSFVVFILQIVFIVGGIITFIGVMITIRNPEKGGMYVLAGGIIGGINIISIGASRLLFTSKEKKIKKVKNVKSTAQNTCYKCGKPIPSNEAQCEDCKMAAKSLLG